MTTPNVLSAFCTTGVYPHNREAVFVTDQSAAFNKRNFLLPVGWHTSYYTVHLGRAEHHELVLVFMQVVSLYCLMTCMCMQISALYLRKILHLKTNLKMNMVNVALV